MQTHEKHLFANVLFREAVDLPKRGKPEHVPESLVKLHDDITSMNRAFCTKTRVDADQYWLMVKLNELSDRIAALEPKKVETVKKEEVESESLAEAVKDLAEVLADKPRRGRPPNAKVMEPVGV